MRAERKPVVRVAMPTTATPTATMPPTMKRGMPANHISARTTKPIDATMPRSRWKNTRPRISVEIAPNGMKICLTSVAVRRRSARNFAPHTASATFATSDG